MYVTKNIKLRGGGPEGVTRKGHEGPRKRGKSEKSEKSEKRWKKLAGTQRNDPCVSPNLAISMSQGEQLPEK
jgi:hypothetical protein